jgi:hypothetical protein
MVGLVMGDRSIVGVRRGGAWGSSYLDVFWAGACGDVIGGQFILVIATGEGLVGTLCRERQTIHRGYVAPRCRL